MNELANQKLVLQKINGWKIYHVSHGMEEVVDMENELSDKLEDFAQRLEDAARKTWKIFLYPNLYCFI